MKKQGGFTLIELVVVIVILGLLAATALPKFIDLTSDARNASVSGVAGGLRAATALGQAQYVVNGNKDATNISMGASNVTVLDETNNAGKGGWPVEATGGIDNAMPNPDGFLVDAASTITGAVGTGMRYIPGKDATLVCGVIYDADDTDSNGDPVEVIDSGC